MSARDPAAVSRFVEHFAEELVAAGMPRMASRIFLTLVATDSGRLTAGDLADRLLASPAAISGGVRYLMQVGMARRGREPGSRRDHYWVENDVWVRAITQRDQLVARWAANLRKGAQTLGPGTPAGARFAESAEFFDFLQQEMGDVLERWEKHRATSRAADGAPVA